MNSDPENHPLAGSVTLLFREFSDGDSVAGGAVYQKCFPKFCEYAQKILRHKRGLPGDEEDVVQSAIRRFWGWLQNENVSDFHRDDFENILSMFVKNKALEYVRKSKTAKRGAGRLISESLLERDNVRLDELADVVPASEFDCWFKELVESLRPPGSESPNSDKGAGLDEVFLMKLAGFSVKEIAEQLKVSTPTVDRKIRLARNQLKRIVEHEER